VIALKDLYDSSWAVIIGINRYERWPSLQYAVNDAEAVRDRLVALGFPERNTTVLLDGQATKMSIERVLGDQLRRQIGPNDRVFIYFAGHGQTEDLPGGGQEGYIVPVDGDRSDLFSTCISMMDIRRFSERMAAKHVFYAIDACYSGLALMRAGGLNPQDQEYLQKMARFPSRQLVTAGSAGEQVVERGGHGAFTRALLMALDGNADKLPPFGVLTGSELGNYLKPVVSVETHNAQTPQFGRISAGEGEFIFLLSPSAAVATPSLGPLASAAESAPRDGIDVPPFVLDSTAFVYIPPGTFTMGSLRTDSWAEKHEMPQHPVTISKGFHLGKYEVTQAQWEAVMGTAPWKGEGASDTGADHPAAYVSWNDVQAFIRKLNRAEGSAIYRLPTEAEWEYACRAGTTTRWSFGEDAGPVESYAWSLEGLRAGAEEVGTKLPNPWDLHDMHGSVWEWCQDWYSGHYYHSSPDVDPRGPSSGTYRVRRGGSFSSQARHVRSAARDWYWPDECHSDIGFRLVRQAE